MNADEMKDLEQIMADASNAAGVLYDAARQLASFHRNSVAAIASDMLSDASTLIRAMLQMILALQDENARLAEENRALRLAAVRER